MKTFNELVDKIARRAGFLAELSMDKLRACYPEETDTQSALIALCKKRGLTRGKMIEDILVEEFTLEFDREIIEE